MGSDNETDWNVDEDEAGDGAEFEFEGGGNCVDGASILELILLLLFFEVSIFVI
jgi:hypothetical protein